MADLKIWRECISFHFVKRPFLVKPLENGQFVMWSQFCISAKESAWFTEDQNLCYETEPKWVQMENLKLVCLDNEQLEVAHLLTVHTLTFRCHNNRLKFLDASRQRRGHWVKKSSFSLTFTRQWLGIFCKVVKNNNIVLQLYVYTESKQYWAEDFSIESDILSSIVECFNLSELLFFSVWTILV